MEVWAAKRLNFLDWTGGRSVWDAAASGRDHRSIEQALPRRQTLVSCSLSQEMIAVRLLETHEGPADGVRLTMKDLVWTFW